MSWLALLSVLMVCWSGLSQSDQEAADERSEEYRERYMDMFRAGNISTDTAIPDPIASVGVKYGCKLPPATRPTSVHELSPEFVDVVAAMGDSVTAAFGAASRIIIDIREFRGLSWSIGGDGVIDDVPTLPNAIRKFNFGLRGFSTGIGNGNRGLNVAVTNSRTRHMLGQAEILVRKLEEQGVTDNQWKVITLWIGGNDLCDVRDDGTTPQELANIYTENVREALDYLKENVKRAFINMVTMIDIAGLAELTGTRLACHLVHRFVCNGIFEENSRAKVSETARVYNENLEQLIAGGNTYDSDDFTVVLQPFFTQTELPRRANGAPDDSYFAPDCFHFSQLGHGAVAAYLWNNMFEPVGSKTTRIDWNNLQPFICPANWPYFSTYANLKVRQNALIASNSNANSVNGESSSRSLSTSGSLFAVLVMTLVGVAIV